MSFLDTNDNDQRSIGYIVGFALLAVSFFISNLLAIFECRRPIYNKHMVRFLFPWALVCMSIENATLAPSLVKNQVWKDIVYALEATVAPSLLLSTFDVTYIIHKTRHVQFCGIYEGQTLQKRPYTTRFVKYSIRLLALLLLILGLLMNFNVGFNPPSPVAGQVGWSYVITEPFTIQQVQVVLSLIPMTVVSIICGYFSLILWKYGTTSSMVVHSSPLNPWSIPMFGSLCLFGGQWFGFELYSILSNVGILLFCISILYIILQVNKDLSAAVDLNVFLGAFDDWRQAECQEKTDLEEKQGGEKIQEVHSIETRDGDDIVVEDTVTTRNENDDVVQVEKDKVKIEKGKVVEFVEKTTEITATKEP